MAFPQPLGTSKGVNGANTTSHNVTLPTSIAAGELIVVCIAADGNAQLGGPFQWKAYLIAENTASATPSALIAWKRANGTEGGTTITFTSVNSEQSSYVAVRFSVGTLMNYLPASLTGNSTNSTFSITGSALIPAKDYTFLAFRAGDGSVQVTAPSTNYTLVDSQAGGGTGASIYVQERELNTQTTTPGAVTVATEQWVTFGAALFFDSFTIEQEIVYEPSTIKSQDAFSFLSNGMNLKKIYTHLFKGTTALSCYAELYAHSGTFGSGGVPTGSPLATSATETITGTSVYGMVQFTFATPYQTTNATPYFIRIVSTGGVTFQSITGGLSGVDGNTATLSGGVWTAGNNNKPPFVLLSETGISGTLTETASGTDTQSVTAQFARTISETATASDLTDETLQSSASITETATATDTTDATLGAITADITEAATGTESQAATATFSRSISEAGTGTDTITATATFSRSISETATASDLTDETLQSTRTISESVTATDLTDETLQATKTISESGAATDLTDKNIQTSSSIAESAFGSDLIVGTIVLPVSISEITTSSDSTNSTRTLGGSVTETVAASETINNTRSTSSSVTETASASDLTDETTQSSRSISEPAAASDLTNRSTVFSASLSEAASGADSLSSTRLSALTISEPASATDTLNFVGSAISASISESTTSLDSASCTLSTSKSISEANNASDAISTNITISVVVTESANSSDSTNAVQVFYSSVSESGVATDSLISFAQFSSLISESSSIIDTCDGGYKGLFEFKSFYLHTIDVDQSVGFMHTLYQNPVSLGNHKINT